MRGVRPGLIALYVAGSALAGLVVIDPTDLDAFFLPSARVALAGHPLDVYSVRHADLYPDANGPLSLVPLTAVAAAASRLGWLDDERLRRVLVMGVFSLFALLLAREAVLAVDRIRGRGLTGWWRLAGYALFAAPPLMWHSVLLYGHIEQPLCLWLVLRAVRFVAEGRPLRGGVMAGLAVLDRSVGALYILPLVAVLLARGRIRAGTGLAAAATLTLAAGLAPLLLAHPADTWFSLVGFREALPIGGGSIWTLAEGTGLQGWAERADGAMVVAGAVAASALVAVRRRGPAAADPDVHGLLALAGLAFPLLIKTVWPYYFLDVYVFGTVWALGTVRAARPRRALLPLLLPLLVSLCALAAEAGVSSPPGSALRRLESTAMFAVLAATAAVLAAVLSRPQRGGVAGALGTAGSEGTAGVPAGRGAEVGPSGGVGQLASAALKGVGDAGVGVGEVPGGGVT